MDAPRCLDGVFSFGPVGDVNLVSLLSALSFRVLPGQLRQLGSNLLRSDALGPPLVALKSDHCYPCSERQNYNKCQNAPESAPDPQSHSVAFA